MPPLPYSDTGSIADLQAKKADAERKALEYFEKGNRSGDQQALLTKRKREETQPIQDMMATRMQSERLRKDEPLAQIPEFQNKGPKPEEVKEAFSTFMIFALLGGALTRQPMQAAMNNMTAAMQGWMAGDVKAAKQNLEEFDRNFKIATAKRTGQIEERKAAHEKYKGDIEALQLEEKQIALKYQDEIAAELARKGDMMGLGKHYDVLAKNYETSIGHAQRVEYQARQLAEKEKADQMRHDDAVARQKEQEKRDQNRHDEMMAQLKEKQREFDKKESDKGAGGAKANSPFGKLAVDEGLKPGTPEFQARVKELEASKGAGKIGSRERAAATNLVSAANEAAINISNLAELSQGSPLFANKLANVEDKGSLLGGVSQFAARRLSTQDQQMYSKIIDALSGSLTKIQNGTGYASDSTAGKIKQLQSVITAKEGATNAVAYQALAEANQIFIRGLESLMTNAALNPEQKALLKRNIREAAEAIPFTVKDVIQYSRSNKVQTMPEWLAENGRKGSAYEHILQEAADEPLIAIPQPGEQIYTDKNGAQAVLRNGKYVEIKRK